MPPFIRAAHEIAGLAGFELYDLFERRLGAYLNRLSDLYYLFELGLRQDILQGMDRQVPYSSSSLMARGSGGITGRSPSSWSK